MGGCCSKSEAKKPVAQNVAAPREVQPQETEQQRMEARLRKIYALRREMFRYNRCTVTGGEVRPCFSEGVAFCIIKDDSWYFYNDSLDYEVHVDYRFGPGSKLTGGPQTTVEETEDGWYCARCVVYPLQTVHYISGTFNGYKSATSAVELSEAYRRTMCAGPNAAAQRELQAVQNLVGGETKDEAVLQQCVRAGVPYVDVNFPPTPEMLSRPGQDVRVIPVMAMRRPTEFLEGPMRRQVDALRGPILPESLEPGLLGDSWLLCCLALLAQDPAAVRDRLAPLTPAEKQAGAYRVRLNKHGWWHEILVDDYLPTVNGIAVFAAVRDDPAEQWVSLLQKAYAKLHGSYASITGGDVLQAVQDFTGLPTYRLDTAWAAAAADRAAAPAFLARLAAYTQAGHRLLLHTPGIVSTTALGEALAADPAGTRARYARAGLQCAHAYLVERLVAFPARGIVLFRVSNPWRRAARWSGAWSPGSSEWRRYPDIAAACPGATAPDDGRGFWIAWEDAKTYFDGAGVVLAAGGPRHDYRVKGVFDGTYPSVVLEIAAATAPVEVTLILSQRDKRGAPTGAPGSRFAPLMLSVARPDGGRYRVQTNTSADPETPSEVYDFAVAREVAMRYTFPASDEPYLVIPRIHARGVVPGEPLEYVVGLLASESLEGRLRVHAKALDRDSRVLRNITTFEASALPQTEVEHQYRAPGGSPVSTVSSVVVKAGAAETKPAPETSQATSGRASDNALTNESDGADDSQGANH